MKGLGEQSEYEIFSQGLFSASCGIGVSRVRMFHCRGVGDSSGLFVLDSLEGFHLVESTAQHLHHGRFVYNENRSVSVEMFKGALFVFQDPDLSGDKITLDQARIQAHNIWADYLEEMNEGIKKTVDEVLQEMAHDQSPTIH